jgi:hypothetical protein
VHRAGWTVVALAALVPSWGMARPELTRAPLPSWLELEIGLEMGRYDWRVEGLQPGTELRAYTLPLFEAMRIRVGLYPLRSASGVFQRLGVELWGTGAFPASLKNPSDSVDYPVGQYELGAVARLGLRVAPWLVLAPAGGISKFHSQVQPARSAAVPAGFPPVDLLTARAGVSLDGTFPPFGVRVEFTSLFLLSGGALFEPPYFPAAKGSFSAEAVVRLGLTLTAPLVLSLEARFVQIGIDLQDPRAAAATARTFVGGFSLRYSG